MALLGMTLALPNGMKRNQRKKYWLVRVCSVCGGVLGLKETDQSKHHMEASHTYCTHCCLPLWKEIYNDL